jgi:hypothetical protein
MWPWQFGTCLAELRAHVTSGMYRTKEATGHDLSCRMYVMAGTYVHQARNKLLVEMIADGCTHMLWLDSDMAFPPDSLQRLLERNVNMVGINYSTRGLPPRYVAIKRISTSDDLRGELCETHEWSTGIEEVEAMGFGMVLMKLDLFHNMNFKENLFWYEMIPGTPHHIGEDVYFCKKVREAGEKIYVDHDLSKECGHVGQMDYRLGQLWECEKLGVADGIGSPVRRPFVSQEFVT